MSAENYIDKIFYQLKMCFPAWRQGFKTQSEYKQIKTFWLETLEAEKMNTSEQISRALHQARLSVNPFFPSVGQFIEWTKTDNRVNHDMYRQNKQFLLEKENNEKNKSALPDIKITEKISETEISDSSKLAMAEMISSRYPTTTFKQAKKLVNLEIA